MFSIIEHIEFLIQKNDCVIIPGWGAIITHYSVANFDIETGHITPPKRTVSFNESITHNDGLLAYSVSRKENISYDEALKLIETEVIGMKKQIYSENEVAIGRIGFFSLSDDEKLCFEPFLTAKHRSDFFGLSAFNFDTLDVVKKRVEDEIEEQQVPNIVTSRYHKFLRYAASVTLLLVMTIFLSTPIPIDDKNNEFASLNIIMQNKKELTKRLENNKGDLSISLPNEQTSIENAINYSFRVADNTKDIAVKYKETNSAQKDYKKTSAVRKLHDDNASYYLIVASLTSLELAERHINKLNDSDLRILNQDGKYRVYIASGLYSELQRLKELDSIDAKYPGAWICRK